MFKKKKRISQNIHIHENIHLHVYIREREKFSTFLQKGIALLRKTEGLKRKGEKKKVNEKSLSEICSMQWEFFRAEAIFWKAFRRPKDPNFIRMKYRV